MTDILQAYSAIISDYTITLWEYEEELYRFQAKIKFKDQSVLIVRDYVFSGIRKYSYHWQNENNQLLCRWDNASHWPDISTFPYHIHVGSKVLPSTEVTLQDVIEHISNEIKN